MISGTEVLPYLIVFEVEFDFAILSGVEGGMALQ